jgi:hypothetical protein
MNEAETRAEHNDPALKTAGWGVVEGRSTDWWDWHLEPEIVHFFLIFILTSDS